MVRYVCDDAVGHVCALGHGVLQGKDHQMKIPLRHAPELPSLNSQLAQRTVRDIISCPLLPSSVGQSALVSFIDNVLPQIIVLALILLMPLLFVPNHPLLKLLPRLWKHVSWVQVGHASSFECSDGCVGAVVSRHK